MSDFNVLTRIYDLKALDDILTTAHYTKWSEKYKRTTNKPNRKEHYQATKHQMIGIMKIERILE